MSDIHGVAISDDCPINGKRPPATVTRNQTKRCPENIAESEQASVQRTVDIGNSHRLAMGAKSPATFWSQLWATTIRTLLIKKRDTRKSLAEVLLPLYSLGVLVFIKMLVPNPNFPEVTTPGPQFRIQAESLPDNRKIAVVAEWYEANATVPFLNIINSVLTEGGQKPIAWIRYPNTTAMDAAYHNDSKNFPIAIIFHNDPSLFGEPLRYTIRTNPSRSGTPSTRSLFTSPALCRSRPKTLRDWNPGGHLIPLSEVQAEEVCPPLQYLYSGFLALQTLVDYTKIKLDTGTPFPAPNIDLLQFPKQAHTGEWLVLFRVIMPMYMVMTLSQFVTYLLMFVVEEKEEKVREGMRIMGLRDDVYWVSWFLIYGIFVTVLSLVSTVLLFSLKVLQHSSYVLIFLLMVLFGFTIISFAFMLTPFFDKARTAGILGSFSVNIMSGLYFIQVFVSNPDSLALWFVSLISSSAYALAMDKALVQDMEGVGVTWDNLWSGPGVPFGGSLIMLAVDTVLYALIAYWLDAVMPSEYGIKQKPWFCFTPSFWLGKRGRVTKVRLGSHSNGEPAKLNRDIEPVPRELLDKEAIRIVGLEKSYRRRCRKPEVKSIDGIELSIYQDQITAILGHNGAGKSTLFNILTGLTAPTAGTAYVFGLDVRDPVDLREIRQMLGVCPQQDVLFKLLTVKEHLNFFAAIKGLTSKTKKAAVSKAMAEVGLSEQAGVFSKHLSGGQKRKLSIAIALIGDPRILILDEPTAGVDPVSRRQVWRILQKARRGKVLLLTTHFMDEADILGDRKAVISKGRIRCAGTSLFLKNKFGIGYHLTMVLDGVSRELQITRLVRGHVPQAERARRHGRELSYILPHYTVHLFPALFTHIETEIRENTSRLGITSYGVSMTTLEEVFLSLEGENTLERDVDASVSSVQLVRARALSRSLTHTHTHNNTHYQELNEKEVDQHPASLPNPPIAHALYCSSNGIEHVKVPPEAPLPIDLLSNTIKTEPSAWRAFWALLYIRTVRMYRDPYKLYLMIFLPILSCALGLYIKSRQLVLFRMLPIKLSPLTYTNTPITLQDTTQSKEIAEFRDSLEFLGIQSIGNFSGNFSSMIDMNNFGAITLGESLVPFGSFLVMFNSTFTHSLPIIVNLLDNSVYRVLMSMAGIIDKFKPIEVFTHPFEQTEAQEELNIGNVVCAIFMGMIFALVPVTLAVDIVYDREIKAKNQLRVNGLSRTMYFATYFTILIVIMLITSVGVLVLVLLNDIPSLNNRSAITMLSILLFLYMPSAILSNTCLSYMFDKMDSAQSILPNITTWVGVIPFILVAVLDCFKWASDAAFYLHVVFSFLNVMYLPYAIVYYVDQVYLTSNLSGIFTTPPLSSYLTQEIWTLIAAMVFHIPIGAVLLYAVDTWKSTGRCCKSKRKPKRDSSSTADVETEAAGDCSEDEDVRIERRRVAAAVLARQGATRPPHKKDNDGPVLLVHDLRKEYKVRDPDSNWCTNNTKEASIKRVGLNRLSLAVEGGEVFGLLGHNGAGKTTTMKIVTAEEIPTNGTVYIGDEQICGDGGSGAQSSAFKYLGYCPQHDALWKNVTLREHLHCYAAIRGVTKKDINGLVDAYLSGLQINEHAHKDAEECSGGTKRKLSFALSMVGSSSVVLLDEPSTGMDPMSKRFLWDTILASFQGKKGAILTTHSMEEADALCSRVGIMVKGGLRCIGSTQHLKNRYGAGYTLEMKIGPGPLDTDLSMSPSSLQLNSNSPSLDEREDALSGSRSPGGLAEPEGETVDVSIHTPLVSHTVTPHTHQHHIRNASTGGANVDAAIALVSSIFPSSVLEECFADRLVFEVPQRSVTSLATCFQQIEQAKAKLNIVEYSFSQTTLEQVFLKFAQNENSDTTDPDH